MLTMRGQQMGENSTTGPGTPRWGSATISLRQDPTAKLAAPHRGGHRIRAHGAVPEEGRAAVARARPGEIPTYMW